MQFGDGWLAANGAGQLRPIDADEKTVDIQHFFAFTPTEAPCTRRICDPTTSSAAEIAA